MGAQPAYSHYPDRAYERAVERAPRIQRSAGHWPCAPLRSALPDSVVFLAKTVAAAVLVVLALIGVARVALSSAAVTGSIQAPGTFQQDRRRTRPRQPAGGHAKLAFQPFAGQDRGERHGHGGAARNHHHRFGARRRGAPTTRATCRCRRACGSRRGPKGSVVVAQRSGTPHGLVAAPSRPRGALRPPCLATPAVPVSRVARARTPDPKAVARRIAAPPLCRPRALRRRAVLRRRPTPTARLRAGGLLRAARACCSSAGCSICR